MDEEGGCVGTEASHAWQYDNEYSLSESTFIQNLASNPT